MEEEECIDVLKKINPHPRDDRIGFEKYNHTYTISNENGKETEKVSPVTEILDSFKPEFQKELMSRSSLGSVQKKFMQWKNILKTRGDQIKDLSVERAKHFEPKNLVHLDMQVLVRYEDWLIKRMPAETLIDHMGEELFSKMKNLPFPSSVGFDKNKIQAGWRKQAELGSKLHRLTELVINGFPLGDYSYMPEFELMNRFLERKRSEGTEWYRTEWRVFDEESFLAGTIDAVAVSRRDSDGRVISVDLFDWKRSHYMKENEKMDTDRNRSRMSVPLRHLKATSRNVYALQLNMYRFILQRKYGLIVDGMWIVVIYPYNERAIEIKVPVMEMEIAEMIDTYLQLNKRTK